MYKFAKQIRKLTVVEMERLQGLPDNFTRYGRNRDGTVYEVSDTMRIKCIGNAVSTPVVADILSMFKKEDT